MTKRRHHQPDPTPAEPALSADGAGGNDGIGNDEFGSDAFGNDAIGNDAFATGTSAESFSDGPDSMVGDMGAEDADVPSDRNNPSVEAELRRERDEAQEKWLRVLAELDNLRKRTRREVVDARRFAQADVLRGFLDILDNLERALQTNGVDPDTGAPDPLRAGIELTRQKFRSVLQEQGVTPIEALGLHLDPLVHEAVGQLPREGSEPGTIIEVAQAGYRLGELVLRPARVIICA